MGYTHYWYTSPRDFPKKQWAAAIADLRKLLKNPKVTLCNAMGDPGTKPTITDDVVGFNGIGPDAHESFHIGRTKAIREGGYTPPGGKLFDFCKTAYKPYDPYVVAALVLLKFHLGKRIKLASDGNWDELQDGIKLAEEVFGEPGEPFAESFLMTLKKDFASDEG